MLLIPDVPIARVFRPAYGIFSFPSSSFVSPLVAAACLFPLLFCVPKCADLRRRTRMSLFISPLALSLSKLRARWLTVIEIVDDVEVTQMCSICHISRRHVRIQRAGCIGEASVALLQFIV